MTLTALAFSIVLSGAPGPTAWPEELSKPLLAKVEPFVWPKPKLFDAKWAEAVAHDAGSTVLRLAIDGKVGWYVVSKGHEKYGAFMLEELIGRDTRFADSVTGETLKVWSWDKADATEVEVAERLEGKVTADALMPWTYVETILESNGPLYAQMNDEFGSEDRELRDLVQSFGRLPEAERLTKITEWAKANRADNSLFERFRNFRPMGTCSMDTTPQKTARLFAELAFARGDLGRFLRLQINIMGDNFRRTAYSSYGEASHHTEAERLTSTGIDLDQFLLGLVVDTQAVNARIDTWRLARAIQEVGRSATLLPKLEALATSPKLDAFNRLRATQTWFFVQARAENGWKRDEKAQAEAAALRKQVTEKALKLQLHPVARDWLKAP